MRGTKNQNEAIELRKAIEQIEPEHLDWQEYERAARVNIKALKIQLRTAESMIRDARHMMDKLKGKSPDEGGPELIQEDIDHKERMNDLSENYDKERKCEQTKTEDADTDNMKK